MKLAIFFHSALLCFLMLQTACVGKKNDSFPTLLQGKWQHIADKTNFLIFEGNKRKDHPSLRGRIVVFFGNLK
jgi:hypothetical protein